MLVAAPPPLISILVPTRDRLSALRGAIASLLDQRPAGTASLYVIDDGSRDGTGQYLAGLAAGGRLVHLETSGRGPAAARNAALRRVPTPFVACTDDDCRVAPDWAARLLDRLRTSGAAAVGGRVVAAAEASRPARLSQAITNGIARALNGSGPEAAFLTSNNVAYRVADLREAGLFDEGFNGAGGEERDLHARLRAMGRRLVHAPEIVVTHCPPMGWGRFVRQQADYGRGARRYYRLGRLGRSPRPAMSPTQYLRAFSAAMAEARPADRAALVLGLPLSQAAVAWGYLSGPRA